MFYLFLQHLVYCQTKDIRLIVGGGFAHHGTGDLSGYSFFNQIDIQLSKRFFLSPGIQFTNSAQLYTLTNDTKLNYVTAGINVFTNLNYSILNKAQHRLNVGIGQLIRFENSSVPKEAGINRGPAGEEILFIHYDKLHSTSFGYNITPSYYYQCSKKLIAGAKFNLQNDTKGDLITSQFLFIGIQL